MQLASAFTNPPLPQSIGNINVGTLCPYLNIIPSNYAPYIPQCGQQSSFTALSLFLRNFIEIAMIAASVIFLFMILSGGFEYLTAGGDKEATQKAQKRLTNAIIGLLITFSVYAILGVASSFFGLDLTSFNVPVIN